jgi:hypothetical protein
MADGQLSIRHRTVGINEQVEAIEKRRNFAVHSWRYLMRGRDEYAPQNAYKVERGRKQKLAPYDNFLRKFQYRKALDAGLKVRFGLRSKVWHRSSEHSVVGAKSISKLNLHAS